MRYYTDKELDELHIKVLKDAVEMLLSTLSDNEIRAIVEDILMERI